jgi:predicted phage tail protein
MATRAPIEYPDTLQSRSAIRIVDVVSEGEIEGLVYGLRGVYLDDTPVQNADGTFNFSGVTVADVKGTAGQAPLAGFPDTETEIVVGTEVKQATPIIRTITNANVNAARVKVRIPALQRTTTDQGDVVGASVQYAIDLRANGGAWVAQIIGRQFVSFAGLVTPANTTAVSAALVWNYTPTPSVDETGTVSFNAESETHALDYRVGAGAWVLGAPLDLQSYVSYGDPWRIDASWVFPAAGVYEIRVRMLSGVGTLSIISQHAEVPHDVVTISGKASSAYERAHRIAMVGSAPWDLRMRRISADSNSNFLQDRTFFESYTELIEQRMIMPHTAAVGIEFHAEQFRTVPRRGYLLRGRKIQVPANYDPATRVYTGSWDGTFITAYSNNPAWVFYDLMLNKRYGLGRYLSAANVDKWSLYTIGQYCDVMLHDGFGAKAPRFTCNLWLAKREEAFRVMQDLASVFRGMLYWGTGGLIATQDAPQTPAYLYNQANVVGGKFVRQGSDIRDRHTVALVAWNDPNDLYKRRIEYVEDEEGIARYGIVQTEVAAFGCTNRAQARRWGKWILWTERLETETITWRVGMDGAVRRPGQVVEIHDPNRAGVRFGGRIKTAAASSATLDASVTLVAGQTYTLSVLLPEGVIETRTVTNGTGTHTVLNVSVNWSVVPLAGAVWLLRSNLLAPEQARIVNVVENEKNEFEITAVRHDPTKFLAIDSNIKLQPLPTSVLHVVPAAVTELALDESVVVGAAGYPRSSLRVSWQSIASVKNYRVAVQTAEGAWAFHDVDTNAFDLADAIVGQL